MLSRRGLSRHGATGHSQAQQQSPAGSRRQVSRKRPPWRRRRCSRRYYPLTSGPEYRPAVTLNGWTLPWRMNGDWKEFHLLAEPVEREFARRYEGSICGVTMASHRGPTIEVVEGDKLRIFVTNKLPEHTTVHWHGVLLPSGMDGVGGLNQPHIQTW